MSSWSISPDLNWSVPSTVSSPMRKGVGSVVLQAMYSVVATFSFRPPFSSDPFHAFTRRTRHPLSASASAISSAYYLSMQERRKNTNSCGQVACRKRRQNNPQLGGRAFARLDSYHPWSRVCRHNNLVLCSGIRGQVPVSPSRPATHVQHLWCCLWLCCLSISLLLLDNIT